MMFTKMKPIMKSVKEKSSKLFSLVYQFSETGFKVSAPKFMRDKKAAYSLLAIIVVITSITVFVTMTVSDDVHYEEQQQTDVLSKRLNRISVKLANIQKVVSKKNAVVDLDAVRSDLNSVTREAQQLASQSDDLITNQIKESTAGLNKQLTAINTKLRKLESEKKRIKYLKAKALPFEVSHIDNIAQQNVVTVSYDHAVFPLDVGDYLADWKLINADFAKQQAEFINHKNQHVIVNLNRINTH